MRVVVDSNVLLVSISRRSKHHPIFQAILNGTITLCVSNSILEEYEEKIGEHWSPTVANNTVETLMKSPFVMRFDPRYDWLLIAADPVLNQYLFLSTFKLPPQYFSIMSCIKTKIIAYICIKNKIKKNG